MMMNPSETIVFPGVGLIFKNLTRMRAMQLAAQTPFRKLRGFIDPTCYDVYFWDYEIAQHNEVAEFLNIPIGHLEVEGRLRLSAREIEDFPLPIFLGEDELPAGSFEQAMFLSRKLKASEG